MSDISSSTLPQNAKKQTSLNIIIKDYTTHEESFQDLLPSSHKCTIFQKTTETSTCTYTDCISDASSVIFCKQRTSGSLKKGEQSSRRSFIITMTKTKNKTLSLLQTVWKCGKKVSRKKLRQFSAARYKSFTVVISTNNLEVTGYFVVQKLRCFNTFSKQKRESKIWWRTNSASLSHYK